MELCEPRAHAGGKGMRSQAQVALRGEGYLNLEEKVSKGQAAVYTGRDVWGDGLGVMGRPELFILDV